MCERQTTQATDPRDLVMCKAEMGEPATLLKTTDLTKAVV